MAPYVDHSGVRQHAMDQAHVTEIIRHFVDEVRPPGADRGRLIEIAAAECGELLERHGAQVLGVAVVLWIAMIELSDDGQHVRQFERAFDARVAGQNLLDQSGTGARQSHDENSGRVDAACMSAPGKKGGIKMLPDTPGLVFEYLDVERNGLAPPRIADRVVIEGPRVLLLVLEGAAERKVQLRLVNVLAVLTLQQRLHGRDLGIAEYIVLEVGEAPVGLAETRIEIEACAVSLLALATAAERFVQMTDGKTQPHFLGVQPRGLLEGRQRIGLAHEARVHRSQQHPVLRILGLGFQKMAHRCFGLGEAPKIDVSLAQAAPGQRQVRRLFEGVPQQAQRIAAAADGERHCRETA